MRLYIDTEYNGFCGDLISMALVAEDGEEFYEVVTCDNPVEWVCDNVMPRLGKEPITSRQFQTKLSKFLNRYDKLHIVADWPEDLKHFCSVLIIGPGLRIESPPFTMECCSDLSSDNSELPHNALHDARAIAAEYLSRIYSQGNV